MATQPNNKSATPDKTEAQASDKLVSVTFIKPWGRYSKGDLAGFGATTADRLVSKLHVAKKA